MEDHNKENSKETQEVLDTERARYCFRNILKKYRDTQGDTLKSISKDSQNVDFGSYTLKYLPFILTRVSKKCAQHHHIYSFDSMLDEALMAALIAEKRYKPELGYDFTTYAKYDIDGALNSFVSSLSNTQMVLYKKVLKFIASYSAEHGKHPSKASIIKGLKISDEKYVHLLQDLEPPTIIPYISISENGEESEAGIEECTQENMTLINDILSIIAIMESPNKELIEMSVIQEMSIDSIAVFLGIPKAEAQGKIDAAKGQLRDILELHGITNE